MAPDGPPALPVLRKVRVVTNRATQETKEARHPPGLFTAKERRVEATRSGPGYQPQGATKRTKVKPTAVTPDAVKITRQQSPPLNVQVRADSRPQTRQRRGFPRGWGKSV